MKLDYCKVRDVKSPNRGTKDSAGLDFFVPEYSETLKKDIINKKSYITIDEDGNITIPKHRSVLIPSGIKTDILQSCGEMLIGEINNVALIAFNKSGITSKKQLIMGACVVDSDYEGEIWVNLINTSDEDVIISCGDKITQFVAIPLVILTPNELTHQMKMLLFRVVIKLHNS